MGAAHAGAGGRGAKNYAGPVGRRRNRRRPPMGILRLTKPDRALQDSSPQVTIRVELRARQRCIGRGALCWNCGDVVDFRGVLKHSAWLWGRVGATRDWPKIRDFRSWLLAGKTRAEKSLMWGDTVGEKIDYFLLSILRFSLRNIVGQIFKKWPDLSAPFFNKIAGKGCRSAHRRFCVAVVGALRARRLEALLPRFRQSIPAAAGQ